MMKKYISSMAAPAVTVSAVKAASEDWQTQIQAVGTLRAVRGVDVANEISGLVQSVHFKSGDNVNASQLLLKLNVDSDIAQMHTLMAADRSGAKVFMNVTEKNNTRHRP